MDGFWKLRNDDQPVIATAIFASAVDRVQSFSKSADFASAVTTAFGADVSADDVARVIAGFDAHGWPSFLVVAGETLHGNQSAYSAEANTVYLSADFLNASSRAAVVKVLIEELGHAIDAQVHSVDAAGDEGAIFADLVTHENIAPAELASLKLENDHGSIVVDGHAIAVEFAGTYGTITVNGTLTDWTAADRLDSAGGGTTNYALYGKLVGNTYVFAMQSGVAIGANTTFWLNTDQNNATGYQVFGFAAGAEFNINIGADLVPRLYSGAAGQTAIAGATLDYAFNGTRGILEFAVPAALLNNSNALNLYADVNDSIFIPNSYANFTYSVVGASIVPPTVLGDITLDGGLTDWTAANRLDTTGGTAGYTIYGKVSGDAYIFAISSAVVIGPNTTAWLNTDQNAATGYQIWGFAGGAEYNVNFTAASKPQLYSGADGATLVNANLPYAFSADKKVVEFAVPKSMIGSPNALNALFDINNNVFISNSYATIQYAVTTPGVAAPVVGSTTLNGVLNDWTQAQRIDYTGGVAGYEVYGKIDGGSFIFALKAPVGVAIGSGTTAWLNADLNTTTGYHVFGGGGIEYSVEFDATGIPRLYSVNATTGVETLVPGANVLYGYSADKTIVEFAVTQASVGNATGTGVLFDVNNLSTAFLPGDYASTQYSVTPPVATGPVSVDGSLADWVAADRIDTATPIAGYEVYGKVSGDSYIIALKAPVAIGANTTFWLNNDQNSTTGFKVFGNSIGAEFNVNFDATGKPMLYTGDAGTTPVAGGANLAFAYSADHKIVEVAIPKALIASPLELDVAIDVNNLATSFIPGDYAVNPQMEITDTAALAALLPPRTDMSKHVAIVYSDTTAAIYFGLADQEANKTAYSQLFMAAQNQAMAAGIPFTVIHESDLKDISKLVNYDTIVFPGFRDVNTGDYIQIHNTLELAVEQYHIGLIAAGDFMTNDQTGAALPGDPYARMKEFFDITRTNGGAAIVDIKAGDVTSPIMTGYTAGELIRHYDGSYPVPPGTASPGTPGVGWQVFSDATPGVGPAHTVIDTQTVGGVVYDAAIAETMAGGSRNVHFSTESLIGDNNQLQHAIQWSAEGAGVQVGLQMSRNSSIFAARNDMDQAQQRDDTTPMDETGEITLPGIEQKLLEVVAQWKALYNFVGSFYATVGDGIHEGENTDWATAGPTYAGFVALGNEIGSHTLTHLIHNTPAEDTNFLTTVGAGPGSFAYEFGGSKTALESGLAAYIPGYVDIGAAVPGMPEKLAASLAEIQYYTYLTGGYSGLGAGYPGAIGYLTPDSSKVYIAPNIKFDFTLVEFLKMSLAAAAAEWTAEVADISKHSDVPVIVFPWHDYSGTQWVTPGDTTTSPYTADLFNNFIAAVAASGAEFVTLADLAQRVASFTASKISFTTAGNVVTATVNSADAGKFALDLDNLGTQKIVSVAGWYAYDDDSVFLPRNGGTYNITLGAAATELTHIITLPSRAELVSLTGDGRNLNFTLIGEGKMTIDLQTPGGQTPVVTGATVVSQVGDILTIDVGAVGSHTVGITLAPAGAAPTITSNGGAATAAITINENLLPVTTVTATDTSHPGTTLTYSISGGADAALFAINAATGALSLNVAADFETPLDAGANNIYDVVVRVTDSVNLFDEQAIALTIRNVAGATQNGTAAANNMIGTAEDETINGAGGNDTINGNGGADRLDGGAGNDIVNGGDGNDNITGAAGTDTLNGDAGNDTIAGGDAVDTIHGGEGNDTITGDAGNDILFGDNGDDSVNGGAGVDTIDGGAGHDIITGGAGFDTLTGGADADTFVFAVVADIGNGTTAGTRDTITDFQDGIDVIDLSVIDATSTVTGNQAFTLIATPVAAGAAFTAAGQLHYYYQTIAGVVHTIIEGNTNATLTNAEFRIDLVGTHVLSPTDFFL